MESLTYLYMKSMSWGLGIKLSGNKYKALDLVLNCGGRVTMTKSRVTEKYVVSDFLHDY